MSSAVFHWAFNWLSGLKTDSAIANYGIYKQCVIEEFNKMPEQARSFPSLVQYLGFKDATIEVEHASRAEGKSSYNLYKLLKLSFDVIVSNSNKPLRLAVGLGFGMAAISFLLAVYNVIARWAGIISVPGYTTTLFSIWFVGGLILFVIGVLGLYIGKIFDQVKGRQLFIVRDKVNF
jgi:dolichol-phosphate mannosyltransferase